MALGFRSDRAPARVSAETFLPAASKIRVRRLLQTRSLRIHQSPARQEQIRQRCGDLQSVLVLRQASSPGADREIVRRPGNPMLRYAGAAADGGRLIAWTSRSCKYDTR